MEEEKMTIALDELLEVACQGNADKSDIANALGEVEIEGTAYQIQLHLVCNKKFWMSDNEVRFQVGREWKD